MTFSYILQCFIRIRTSQLFSFSQISGKDVEYLSNFYTILSSSWASLVPQMIKNLPAVQDTWLQSLGQEDPLEDRMATRSGILAWRIPQTEEPGRLQSMQSQRVGHD